MGRPLLLVGGGSGIMALMAMLRHRHACESRVAARPLYSSHSQEDFNYRSSFAGWEGRAQGWRFFTP